MENNNQPPEDKRSRKEKKRARYKEKLKNKPKRMHIDALPKEALGIILREVPILDRLLNCEGVSRRWKSTALELGWTDVKQLDYMTVFGHKEERSILKFSNKIHELLVALFRRIGPNLIDLNLTIFIAHFKISPDISSGICRWLHLLPNLRKLFIQRIRFRDAVDFLPQTLLELNASGPYDQKALETLSLRCPHLESITLINFCGLECKVPVTAMNTFFGKYPNLKTLHLSNFTADGQTNAKLTSLGKLKWLEELSLFGIKYFDDVALRVVASGCRQLKRLTLTSIAVSEEAILELNQHPNLTDFEVRFHPNLAEATQKAINKRWKSKKYKFLCSKMITDNNILNETLREIEFARRYLIGDESLVSDLVEWGILPLLFKCMNSTRIFEQSLLVFAKIIAYGPEFRDRCIEQGIIKHLLKIAEGAKGQPSTLLLDLTSVFVTLCSHKTPPLPMDITKSFMPILGELIYLSDTRILYNTASALSHIADGGSERIQCVIDLGVVPRLVSLLSHSDAGVQYMSLFVLGNMLLGTDDHAQLILESGVLKKLPLFLSSNDDTLLKKAVWFLTNASWGTEQQVQILIDTRLVPVVIHLLAHCEDPEIRTNTTATIANIAIIGRPKNAMYLVDHGAIPPLCDFLDDGEPKIYALRGLNFILQKAGGRKKEICWQIIECGGLEKVKQLRNHVCEEISDMAHQIVDDFFPQQNTIIFNKSAVPKDKKVKK